MSSTFFNSSSYFIDEKVNFLQFENSYKMFDDKGVEVGSIRQKLSVAQKLLRLVLNKGMLPFHLEIKDLNGDLQASVSRGWTFFLSKIVIADGNGAQLGIIKQKFRLFKPTFTIYSNSNDLLATISGDWKAWEFSIKDAKENSIGSISKKWAGAMQELFTSADKYMVDINPQYTNDSSKTAVIASAVTIDMVLKESK